MRFTYNEICEICELSQLDRIDLMLRCPARKWFSESTALKIIENNEGWYLKFSEYLRSDKNIGCVHYEESKEKYMDIGVMYSSKNSSYAIPRRHQKFICKKCGSERWYPMGIFENHEYLANQDREEIEKAKMNGVVEAESF